MLLLFRVTVVTVFLATCFSSRTVVAQSTLDDETARRIAAVVQDAVQGKTKFLALDSSLAFARGASWGITSIRETLLPAGLSDSSVLATMEVQQKIFFANIAIDPGSYYVIKFATFGLTEAQLEKEPQKLRLIFVTIPSKSATTDFLRSVKASASRIAPALVARKMLQPTALHLYRFEGILSNAVNVGDFTFGATLGALSVCWAVSLQAQTSLRPANNNKLPALVISPIAPDSYAAIEDNLEFDVSTSRDPDGQIKASAWDYGDRTNPAGAQFLTPSLATRSTHKYTHLNKYVATYKAVDSQCGFAQTSQMIEIRPWLKVLIKLSSDFVQVPATGPVALRADVFNNSTNRRFVGQTFINIDEINLFGPAPLQVDPRQGLEGIPASFDVPQPLSQGRHQLSVLLKEPNGAEQGRDEVSFEVPNVSVAIKPIGETALTELSQVRFDTLLSNISKSDFKGTIELILTKPDKSKKSMGPKQPVEVKANGQLVLPVGFPAAGLPKGNLTFTVELRTSSGTKIDQASILYKK
jgi:hypothetical protein